MLNKSRIYEYSYELPNKIMTKYQLLRCLVSFRRDILLTNSDSISLQLKIKLIDFYYRSISGYSTIKSKNDLMKVVNNFLFCIYLRSEIYNQIEVEAYVIGYIILSN